MIRIGLIVVLLSVLAWSLVAFGPVNHAPSSVIRSQETTAIITDPASHIGEKVVASGVVLERTPPRIRAIASGVENLRVTDTGATTFSVGDRLYVFGTLTGPTTVDARQIHVVEPWESKYMLGVSFLGGLFVFARLVRDWRPDLGALGFVPQASDGRRENCDD